MDDDDLIDPNNNDDVPLLGGLVSRGNRQPVQVALASTSTELQ